MDDHAELNANRSPNEPPPKEHWDVFLSYASEDDAWVKPFVDKLKTLDLQTFDPYAAPAEFWGKNRAEVIAAVFPRQCRVAFVALSTAYSASDACQQELAAITESATQYETSLVLPVRLDDSLAEEAIRSHLILDARSASPEDIGAQVATKCREWTKATTRTVLALVDKLRPAIMRVCRSYSISDVEDVVQDTICRALNQMRKKEIIITDSWLMGAVKEVLFERMSRQSRWQKAFRALVSVPDAQPSTWNSVEQLDEVDRIWQGVEMLSPQDQEIIKLIYLENLTATDVAERLGVSENFVRQRTYRALSRLRTLVGIET
ncbi:MAG: sigma-70 family RNA polymerase sigma factor [Planctomycetales bacterium]